MGGQPVGGDADHAALEPGGDHPPADGALQPAQRAEAEKASGPAGGNAPPGPEPEEAKAPDEADDPAELAVAPFPPVDHLELVEGHAPVDELVLRDLAVLVEFGLPRGGVERRQRAGDRAPFGDREARIGEACHAAHRDHHHDEGEKDAEPDGDGAAGGLGPALAGGGRGGGAGLGDLLENAAGLRHVALRSARC